MTNTPLEDEVRDALHRRVDPLQHSSLTVTDVRRRARRIRRRRATTVGAAVAAVLAIVVPVGLALDGPSQRTVVPPATQPPAVTGPVRIDPRSAEAGAGPAVPLIDTTGPTLVLGDESTDLPQAYDQVTQYRDGWIAMRRVDVTSVVDVLDASFGVIDSGARDSDLTVSPDGSRVAWATYGGGGWSVLDHDVADEERDRPSTTVPEGPDGSEVGTIGFVSDDAVLVFQLDELTGTIATLLADSGELVDLSWIDQAVSASPVTGMIAAAATVDDGRTCGAVFDGRTRVAAEPVWTDCERTLADFNADGSLVIAYPERDPGSDGNPPGVSVLDATTGASMVDFEVTRARDRPVGIAQAVWEDDRTLLATYVDGNQQYVLRLGLDGTVERVAGPVRDDDYTLSLRLTPGAVG